MSTPANRRRGESPAAVAAAAAPQSAPKTPSVLRFSVADEERHNRYILCICDGVLSDVLAREVITVSLVDQAVEVTTKSLARHINAAERLKLARRARQRTEQSSEKEEEEDSKDGSAGAASLSIKTALLESIMTDAALFFALANELYEISRDPFYGGGNSGQVWTLQDHCPGFRVCCEVFGEVYRQRIRPIAERMPNFSRVSLEDLMWYRNEVRETFKLRQEEPSTTGPSVSNLDSDWVNTNVRNDQYFFNEQTRRKRANGAAAAIDITLSNIPLRKRKGGSSSSSSSGGGAAAAAGAERENEMNTYYLTELLQNPSWEPEDACAQCWQCGKAFKNVSWPLGVRAHHCRSCGRRLCTTCITHRAHRSFAKLTKPGLNAAAEPDERLVCDACFTEYLHLEKHRYLGALFAFGGLDFAHLSLCRTVSRQWRHAAELCISEYRLLLHQCEPDLKSVLTPVGVLLQNSIGLIVTSAPTISTAAAAATGTAEGREASAKPPALFSVHPEPALLLLKFIAAQGQWDAPSAHRFMALLSSCAPHHIGPGGCCNSNSDSSGRHASAAASRQYTHWHFYCTTFCSRMLPSYFAVKACEHLSAAPETCAAAREAVLQMARRFFAPAQVLRNLQLKGGSTGLAMPLPTPKSGPLTKAAAFFSSRGGNPSSALSPLSPPSSSSLLLSNSPELSTAHTAATTNAETTVMWLLDLLYRDAEKRDPRTRCFQLLLEAALPPLAASSVPLAIIMLCSLQSAYSFRSYDEELLGSWRARIWEEVGGALDVKESSASTNAATTKETRAQVRATLEATMDFFTKLDAFCAQRSSDVSSTFLSHWLREYCTATSFPSSSSFATGQPTRPSTVTLPRPSTSGAVAAGSVAPAGAPSVMEGTGVATAAGVHSMYDCASHRPTPTAALASSDTPKSTTTSTAAATTMMTPSIPPSASSSALSVDCYRSLAKGVFLDLPQPIYNPFKPEIQLRSIRVSDIRVEATSSTRPVWLTFSTYSNTDRDAYIEQQEAKRCGERGEHFSGSSHHPQHTQKSKHADLAQSTTTAATVPDMQPEQVCELLYKRENAERDQLMCISSRLLQLFLKDEIGDAQLTNYSVLPLSSDSALIEKADGYVLSKLPGVSSTADITSFLNQLGDSARKNFLASAKLFLLLNYIFSIGDRHQGNVMVSFNGAILHIDFGFIFSERTFVEKLAGTTMRVDNQFLSAVASCRRALRDQETEKLQQKQQQHQWQYPQRARLPAPLLSQSPHSASTSPSTAATTVTTTTTTSAAVSTGATEGSSAAAKMVYLNAANGAIVVPTSTASEVSPPSTAGNSAVKPQASVEYDEFFREAADWFLALRPHAAVFYKLWLYAANRQTVNVLPGDLAVAINSLFDRNASRESSGKAFASTMKQSINVCRLKDVTHSGVQALKSYSEQVTKRVSQGGYEAMRSLGSLWNAWAKK